MEAVAQSQDIKELAAALAKAQGEFKAAKKDAENPYFKSNYADLTALIDVAQVALAKNGLAVVQVPCGSAPAVALTTMIMHGGSGQWISGTYSVQLKDADPQKIGSALSYLRRYGYSAMLGLRAKDDDGEDAMDRQSAPRQNEKKLFTSANPKAKKWLDDALVNNQVPAKYWKEILDDMEGKPAEYLDDILRMIGETEANARPQDYEVVDRRIDPRQNGTGIF